LRDHLLSFMNALISESPNKVRGLTTNHLLAHIMHGDPDALKLILDDKDCADVNNRGSNVDYKHWVSSLSADITPKGEDFRMALEVLGTSAKFKALLSVLVDFVCQERVQMGNTALLEGKKHASANDRFAAAEHCLKRAREHFAAAENCFNTAVSLGLYMKSSPEKRLIAQEWVNHNPAYMHEGY
jgi:hypothetical protein